MRTVILFSAFLMSSSYAAVITSKVGNAYHVQLTERDYRSFMAALPEFHDVDLGMIDGKGKSLDVFKGYFDYKNKTFGTLVFESLDKETVLDDPSSPYRRISIEGAVSSRIRLYLNNRQWPEIKDLYESLQITPIQRNSKWDKTWKSEDGTLKIFCTYYTFPMGGYTHTCAISLAEPKE